MHAHYVRVRLLVRAIRLYVGVFVVVYLCLCVFVSLCSCVCEHAGVVTSRIRMCARVCASMRLYTHSRTTRIHTHTPRAQTRTLMHACAYTPACRMHLRNNLARASCATSRPSTRACGHAGIRATMYTCRAITIHNIRDHARIHNYVHTHDRMIA